MLREKLCRMCPNVFQTTSDAKFCSDKCAAFQEKLIRKRDRKTKPPEKRRRVILKGLSEVKLQRMLEEQEGLCKICQRPQIGRKRLAIDHCHETRKVRGLLCTKCNVGLGMFGDSVERLRRAISYLKGELKVPKNRRTPLSETNSLKREELRAEKSIFHVSPSIGELS